MVFVNIQTFQMFCIIQECETKMNEDFAVLRQNFPKTTNSFFGQGTQKRIILKQVQSQRNCFGACMASAKTNKLVEAMEAVVLIT